MGLSDILNGMLNGPRGQRQPQPSSGGGGMSPLMMALLGLLAYKALKGRGGQAVPPGGTSRPMPPPGSTNQPLPTGANTGGGLGDILDALSQQTGMERDDLLAGLSQHLPELVD